jgi:hypothetical protein
MPMLPPRWAAVPRVLVAVRAIEDGLAAGHVADATDRATLARLSGAFPDAIRWRALGERRYRALRPATPTGVLYLVVLVTPDRARWQAAEVTDELIERMGAETALEWAWHKVAARMIHELLPECLVPGCTGKGSYLFVAAGHGRLGGVRRAPGDELRLCPAHAHDVYCAQGAMSSDELAGWLRPDARAELDDPLYPKPVPLSLHLKGPTS